MSQSITMEPNNVDATVGIYERHHFHNVLDALEDTLHEGLVTNSGALFISNDTRDLWKVYLRSFQPQHRQYHKCDCCQRFITRFGKLVSIDSFGKPHSAVWDERALAEGERNPYFETIKALRLAVEKAAGVSGLFITEEQHLGKRTEGGWDHLAMSIADSHWRDTSSIRHTRKDMTPEQVMAAKKMDHSTLVGAITYYSKRTLQRAIGMLQVGLHRSEKFLPQAEFLMKAFIRSEGASGAAFQNELWTLVADAPAGWCAPKGTSLGALLDDIAANYPLAEIGKRHNARVAGDKYQRPTAPAKAGNIDQAEALFAKLNLERSLERRFATLKDIQPMWLPADQRNQGREEKQGIFSAIRPGEMTGVLQQMATGRRVLNHKAIVTTFAKFQRDILSKAMRIQAIVPTGKAHFGCFTTAVHPDAEPLLAWDHSNDRNPVAWYQYTKGSDAANWKLQPQTAVEVRAIAKLPPCWNDTTGRWKEFGSRALVVMQGAADRTNETAALFPETLRGELHGVRQTIEAYSKSKTLAEPAPEQGLHYAAGLLIGDNQPIELLVWIEEGIARYTVDRWE